jgi:hypothetical protein
MLVHDRLHQFTVLLAGRAIVAADHHRSPIAPHVYEFKQTDLFRLLNDTLVAGLGEALGIIVPPPKGWKPCTVPPSTGHKVLVRLKPEWEGTDSHAFPNDRVRFGRWDNILHRWTLEGAAGNVSHMVDTWDDI